MIYVDFTKQEKTYLITAYDKSVTEDLTQAERNELRILVKILESELDKKG